MGQTGIYRLITEITSILTAPVTVPVPAMALISAEAAVLFPVMTAIRYIHMNRTGRHPKVMEYSLLITIRIYARDATVLTFLAVITA